MMSYSALKLKEVIRLCDAGTVGIVTDLVFDACTAQITALCVTPLAPGAGLFCRKKKRDICGVVTIPWSCIVRIGESCILVDLKM